MRPDLTGKNSRDVRELDHNQVKLVGWDSGSGLKIDIREIVGAKSLAHRVRMKSLVRMTCPTLQPEHSQTTFHPAAPGWRPDSDRQRDSATNQRESAEKGKNVLNLWLLRVAKRLKGVYKINNEGRVKV